MRLARSHSNLTSVGFISLLLSYSIAISLVAPFAMPRVKASPPNTKSGASPASKPAKKKGGQRDGELVIRFREQATEQDKSTLAQNLAA